LIPVNKKKIVTTSVVYMFSPNSGRLLIHL
jgi:hypothetical protein